MTIASTTRKPAARPTTAVPTAETPTGFGPAFPTSSPQADAPPAERLHSNPPPKPTRSKRKAKGGRKKVAKPYPDFPLTPHASGKWCKKIRGKLHYFGRVDDWRGALEEYQRIADDLHAGRQPDPNPAALTVRDLLNRFLQEREQRLNAGELNARTWQGYRRSADLIAAHFGLGRSLDTLRPDDFTAYRAKLTPNRSPVTVGNEVRHARIIFRFAYQQGLVEKPIRTGTRFAEPSKKVLRKHKREKGRADYAPEECRAILDGAGTPLRAMVLLALNCGFGNTDCATLPTAAVDLDAGRLIFPRPKTEVDRRGVLWPETVAALRDALDARRDPADAADAGLLFLTRRGRQFVRAAVKADGRVSTSDAIAQAFTRAAAKAKVATAGRGFYGLRHTFRTIADAARDQPAADLMMGHADGGMAGVYRERIGWDRLRAVASTVRTAVMPDAAPWESVGVEQGEG
jgi:integrase